MRKPGPCKNDDEKLMSKLSETVSNFKSKGRQAEKACLHNPSARFCAVERIPSPGFPSAGKHQSRSLSSLSVFKQYNGRLRMNIGKWLRYSPHLSFHLTILYFHLSILQKIPDRTIVVITGFSKKVIIGLISGFLRCFFWKNIRLGILLPAGKRNCLSV